MDWLTLLIIIPIHTGFAGLLGLALRRSNWRLSLLSFLLVSISPLMLPGWLAILFWLYAIALIFIFLKYASRIPEWLWRLPLETRYWGTIMLLIALWGIINRQYLLSSFALMAALLSLTNSIRKEKSLFA